MISFRQQIEAISGFSTSVCFQCSKCSAGCPMAGMMDLKTAQVMHSIRLNREDVVLNSTAIWLCVGCETCSSRCPQQVEPAEAMNAARILALRRGIKPSVKEVGIYYNTFVGSMWLNGKIHDTSVAGVTSLLTGNIIADIPLALKLLMHGRIKLPPIPFTGSSGFRKIRRRARAREGAREKEINP
jgi:heterodisulfide reductase subunit C